ncbi:MAG: hypothetical protein KJZ78_24735 [Bryobacteraceae bacterium]|nr:hypothetical protein [Bryobacteraceae bacterium]
MKKAFLLLVMAVCLASGQSLDFPTLGYILAGDRVAPLFGVAGAFSIGEPQYSDVLSAAFSGRAGLLKTAGEVLVLDSKGRMTASVATPEGPALFAFSAQGFPGGALFPAAGEIYLFQDAEVTRIAAELPAGEPVALGVSDSGTVTVLLDRDGGLWKSRLSIASGQFETAEFVPEIQAPAVFLPGGSILGKTEEGLVILHSEKARQPIPLHFRPSAIERIGSGWLLLQADSGARYGIRLDQPEHLYELPGGPQ